MKTFANVGWTANDVQTLAPKMTEAAATEWLERKDKELRDRMIELGWQEIQIMLSYDSEETSEADDSAALIKAEVHSDDFIWKVDFDAVDWFKQASPKEIVDLHKIDWRGDYPADVVAEFFAGINDDIGSTLDHCRKLHRLRPMGFECSVNAKDALLWLADNRPEVFKLLEEDL